MVWDLIKKRVEGLLFTPFLMRCKVERLLYIFSLTKLLIEHGELYDQDGGSSANNNFHTLTRTLTLTLIGGSSANNKLHKRVQEESLKYFQTFDRSNVSAMLDALDNESFFMLRKPPDFTIQSIPELRQPKASRILRASRMITVMADSP